MTASAVIGIAAPNANLDDEARQHLLDAPCRFQCRAHDLRRCEAGSLDEIQLELQLARGSEGYIEKPAQVSSCSAAASLRDVRADRDRCAPKLTGELEPLLGWKHPCDGVYFQSQLPSGLIHAKPTMILHASP